MMATVSVDFSKTIGKIKPMHAVGQPPFLGVDFSMFHYLKEASIPYSRLHDVGGSYGANRFVDIPNLFRDFSADENDPASYDFTFTDLLITALIENGIEPVFRLGVTIENYAKIKPYRIFPPSDPHKWARICEHVIRHYTEGWADGFYYNIQYWEIWNEPDNFESVEENQMWHGTKEEYFALYEAASKHLKACFPHLSIGGYASCGFYAVTGASTTTGACSPRYQYFIDFFDAFLAYVKEHDCPFDFFSWHSYASEVETNVAFANYARRRLDEAGYTSTEQSLNEWNPRADEKGTLLHAALTLSNMLALQNTSLDSAMFYDARCGVGMYSGLFNCYTYEPLPTYYTFLAFGELYRAGTQVTCDVQGESTYALAAKSDKGGCVVVTNNSDKTVPLTLAVAGADGVKACKIIAEGRLWEDCALPNELAPYATVCVWY